MSDNNNSSSGIGFVGLLTVMLIGLKILGYFKSWWIVFLPALSWMLIKVIFVIVVLTIMLLKERR